MGDVAGAGPDAPDAAAEDAPARLTRLAARLLDAPAAALHLMDGRGETAAAAFGLDDFEAALAAEFCARAVRQRRTLVLHGAPEEAEDSRIRFRAATPMFTADGLPLGALAVLDRRPRPDVGPAQAEALRDLAQFAAAALAPAGPHPGGAEARVEEGRWRPLQDRLKTLALEAPGYEATLQATTRAVCEAAEGLLCTLHRLGADGLSLHLVGGFAAASLGGDARLRALRARPLDAADPLLRAAIADGRQSVIPAAAPGGLRDALVAGGVPDALLGGEAQDALTLVATPLRIGEERCVLLLGTTAPDAQLAGLLRDAAATLRPLLQMLRDEERMLLHRRVVESSSEAVLILEATPDEGRIVHVNPAFALLTGFHADELVGRTPQLLQASDDPGEAWRIIGEAVRRQRRLRQGAEFRRKDGTSVWVELHIAPVADADGRCTHLVAMVRDVTREREATRRLADSEAAFRSLFERNPIPMWIYDQETLAFLSVNDAAVEDYGWSREAFLGMSILEIRPPEDRGAVRAAAASPRREGRASGPWRHLTADGREKIVEVISHLTVFAGRRAVLVAALDITARTRFERDLAASRAALQRQAIELRQTQRLARIGTWRWEPDAKAVAWSDEVHAIFGTDPAGPAPSHAAAMALVHSEDRAGMEASIAGISASGRTAAFEFRVLRPEGKIVHCRAEGHWEPDPAGGQGSVHGYVQDVTAQREAEAALRQADRLTALGQLTGGIAHDFNNLLTVASVSLEMAAESARDGKAAPDLIDSARSALERGTRLTSQLLSYARRQPLRPEALDLGRLLPERLELVRRTLGERHTLELDLAETGPISADPAQLEAALVNLLVNARDAMPVGGPITVETRPVVIDADTAGQEAELAPGRYAMIAVSDRGTGMSPTVKARIFEPFFTTKPPGRGTGLGLSMVLGFAKQSGGHVAVASEPGRGTTMKLFLPTVQAGAEPPVRVEEPAAQLPPDLDVLVVEDQADVREAAVRLCREVGLQPVSVTGAAEALAVLGAGIRFDLVFTDLVLGGGMDGLKLAEAALRLQPGLAVVCTSGYSEQYLGQGTVQEHGLELLTKPYDIQRFRAAVSRALAAATARPQPAEG
ncbi:PAS domain S-box protein [Falsiroseomonas sp.]|uniref:PAS domain S-box protein n=1 Tax=Falsiroseomonas sp. TaxID=2870721 RepID=UPI0035667963